MSRQTHLMLIIVLIAVLALVFSAVFYQKAKVGPITTFDQCAQAGNPIAESYPATCRADGQVFVQPLTEEEKIKLQPPPTSLPTEGIYDNGSCAAAGYAVTDAIPSHCSGPNGQNFVEESNPD